MKKKLLLIVSMVALLVCLLAFGASAAEPDTTRETVTLSDGTQCALWDTDGNPLIWYVTSTDADTGVKTYAYVDATSSAVAYINTSNSTNQLDNVTITVDGVEYAKTTIAVINMPNAKITTVSSNGRAERVGEEATRIYKTFQGCSNLEYAYLNTATTSVGQESFKGCSNLVFINLAELSELTTIGIQAFNSCSKLFSGIALNLTATKVKEISNLAFCTAAFTNVVVPEATFTTLGDEAFRECVNLETVTGTKNAFGSITSIGSYSFKNCYKLKQLDGFIENGVLTIPEGVTSVGVFAFTECDGITYIDFPSTFNYVGQQGFSYMSNVKILNFDKITGVLTLNNCGHFRDMDNLIAVSLPEGMIEVNNRAFASCDNLTAFYMPNSVQRLSSNGGGQGTFCESKKMYFVQQPFTVSQCLVDGVVDTSKLVLPEKPTVYYMPTSLQTFTGHTYTNDTWSNATIFKNCASLNDVLVFPESFTVMISMRPYDGIGTEASPKTIVYLGDMTQMTVPHQSRYITFVFANANDKDYNDLGIVRTTGNSSEKGSYAFFCSTGMKYDLDISGRASSDTDATTEESIANIKATIDAIHATATVEDLHIYVIESNTEATCTVNGVKGWACFCGKGDPINSETVYAKGHEKTGIVSIVYNGTNKFFEKGDITYTCGVCTQKHTVEGDASVIFVALGLSGTERVTGSYSVIQGFKVNHEAKNLYNQYSENDVVGYGLVAGTKLAVGENAEIFDNNGNVTNAKAGVVNISARAENYDIFEMKISGLENEHETYDFSALELYCCGYCLVQVGADVVSYYASEGVVTETLSITTTYNTLQPISQEG